MKKNVIAILLSLVVAVSSIGPVPAIAAETAAAETAAAETATNAAEATAAVESTAEEAAAEEGGAMMRKLSEGSKRTRACPQKTVPKRPGERMKTLPGT